MKTKGFLIIAIYLILVLPVKAAVYKDEARPLIYGVHYGKVLFYGMPVFDELKAGEDHPLKIHDKKIVSFVFTNFIVVKKGVNFGIVYTLEISPPEVTADGKITVIHRIRHPIMHNQTTDEYKMGSRYEQKIVPGRPVIFLFQFDEDRELVDGEFIFEVWYKDTLVVEKSFLLYLP